MTDLQRHAGALGRLHHLLGLLDADRHRLFGEYVLFRRADLRDMLGMQFGRCRDVDGAELGASQHRRQIGVNRNAGLRGDGFAHFGDRFGNRRQLKGRITANRRQERPTGGAHSNDPDADFAGHTCSYDRSSGHACRVRVNFEKAYE